MKQALFIGAFASVLTLNAFADTTSSTVTSKNYVDAQDALKQDVIPVETMTIDAGKGITLTVPDKLVAYPTTTDGDIGKYGVFNQEFFSSFPENFVAPTADTLTYDLFADTVPTTNIVGQIMVNELSLKQDKIYRSGYVDNAAPITGDAWLINNIKGVGLVTKTDTDGVVGERKIFEANDVSNYHASGLTQKQKDIQDISIPTVGAMMTAISNNQVTLPTGTAGNVVTYNSNGVVGGSVATYTGAAAYNATNDSAKIPTMAGVTNYAQAKKVCVGWPDGTTVADATHTDANCWLWNLPD